MTTIIHGTDTVASREYLFGQKSNNANSILLEGEGLTFDQIFQSLENKSFFDEKIVIFIENFLTKNKSNTLDFKKIAKFLNDNKSADVFLWENSEIKKTVLSQFPKAEIKGFSLPQSLFLFLDNIVPSNANSSIKLFHELSKTTAPELIFFMMLRQFRILIAVADHSGTKISELKRLAPWQEQKFRKQLSLFGEDKLTTAYNKLFELEINHKTGKVPYSMDKSIDFFLASL